MTPKVSKNIGEVFFDINCRSIFLDQCLKAKEIKAKTNQLSQLNLKFFVQQRKWCGGVGVGNYTEWEKTFAIDATIMGWFPKCTSSSYNSKSKKKKKPPPQKKNKKKKKKWVEDSEIFSKENILIANRHMNSCSTSLIIKSKPQRGITSHRSERLSSKICK